MRYVPKENGLITETDHANLWEHKDVWATYSLTTTATIPNETLVISSKSKTLNNKLLQYNKAKE
ncbi:MAG: hypothetical protein MK137_02430 [Rickettsiales bacterium]|nr:hypothetical protein [Rickettsiales bacterium]